MSLSPNSSRPSVHAAARPLALDPKAAGAARNRSYCTYGALSLNKVIKTLATTCN